MSERRRAISLTILTSAAALLMVAGPVDASRPGESRAPVDSGTVIVNARAATPASPDVFGTVALDAGVTADGARWRRVSAADENDPRIRTLAAAAVATGADPLARLTAIHSDVGHRVVWQRDLDTYSISDYWAQAGETLTRGKGDSEDIAIVKMQVLKAAGFAPRDIYLSIGRDQSRGSDTLLLVRVGGNFYALDDRSPQPFRATSGMQFKPVITLGRNSAWIHGRRTAARQARTVAATLR